MVDTSTPMLFVLAGEYSDKSGREIVRVYSERETAERDMQMLDRQCSCKRWVIEEVEWIDA